MRNAKLITTLFAVAIGSHALADEPAHQLGPGGQMKPRASAPRRTSGYGAFWINSADSNKLYYTDPSGTSGAVGSGGGGGAPTVTSLSETSGNLGDQVLIYGTNLAGATAVDFNGTAVSSYTVDSATQITARVANSTSTGAVHVTVPSGSATGPSWTLSTSTHKKAISMAYSSAGPVGVPITMALPIWLPEDVTQIRVHIANLDVTNPTTTISSCAGVDVGIGTSNGTNGYSGSPTTYLSQTIPADGAWLDLPSSSTWTTVTRGSDGKIILAYTIPGACSFYQTGSGVTWGQRNVGTGSVDPLPALSANNSIGYTINIEYITGHKRVVVLGDSLAVGYSASPYNADAEHTAWELLGPDHGYAVDGRGIPGATLAQWSDSTNKPHYTDQQVYAGAYCVIEVGVNDLTGYTLSQYQTAITNKVSFLKGAGCKKVYAMTPPTTAAYSAQDSLRQTWLSWLRTTLIPANLDGIIDADATVASTPGGSTLNASYDSNDGTHWNNTGHAAVEALNYALIN